MFPAFSTLPLLFLCRAFGELLGRQQDWKCRRVEYGEYVRSTQVGGSQGRATHEAIEVRREV